MLLSIVFAGLATVAPAPAPAVQPISVQVEAVPKAPAEIQAWANELRSAVIARKDEFRAPKQGEKPELLVRLTSLTPTQPGKAVLSLAVQRAGQTRPFTFSYAGEVRKQAELLARNLRMLTDPMVTPAPKK